MKDKNIFENKIKSSTIKYVIISFSVFVLLLSVFSVVLLMHSLDYDINNLLNSTVSATENIDETVSDTEEFSVKDLTGKSRLLFAVKDGNMINFAFVVLTDFDNESMKVKCLDGNTTMYNDGHTRTLSEIYASDYELGLKSAIHDNLGIQIDKYVVFNQNDLKDVLSLFEGFSVDVKEEVNYKSFDFNLTLQKGRQDLSPDLTYKYLIVSNNEVRENILCNVISSVLSREYVENSEKLFISFVNLSKTDISIIDYSESIKNIETYCYADNKFYPEVWEKGDS